MSDISMGQEMMMEALIEERCQELSRGNARQEAITKYIDAFLSKQQLIHECKDGNLIPFDQITDTHLDNIIKMFERNNDDSYNMAYNIELYEMERRCRMNKSAIITYGAMSTIDLAY